MSNVRRKTAFDVGIFAVVVAVLVAGCTVGPKYHRPSATAQTPPPAYKEVPDQESDEWRVAQPQDAMLHGKWWEIYNDPELNALEDQLNINNQNIKQFFENFMEARTLIAQARSQLYPTIGTTPAYQRSRASANLRSGNGGLTTGGTTTTTTTTSDSNLQSQIFSLPVEASWVPDLWGKVRNTIHEAQYNAQLSAADLENERLTEQASLAMFYFELRGQDALQRIFDGTVDADRQSVELARSRYETGVDDELSLV
jgi:outer membrane protein TolC